jgi:tetratricopeptide (TPR) repeat protein
LARSVANLKFRGSLRSRSGLQLHSRSWNRVTSFMSMAWPNMRGAIGIAAAALTLMTVAPLRAASLSDMLNQRIVEAQRAEAEKAFEQALTTYTEALQISENTPAAKRMVLRKRAALYEQLNMSVQAEQDLTAAFGIEPFDPKAFADRGYFYMRQGRYSEALDDFIAGSRAQPKDASFMYGAGRVLVAARDDMNAVKFYDEAIKIAPRDAKLYLARAEAFLRQQKYNDAQVDYDRAFVLGMSDRTDRFYGFVGRGYVNAMKADFGLAVQAFNQALDIFPDSSNVLLWRGYAFERKGERDRALRDYERAAASMPDDPQARSGAARMRSQVASDTGPSAKR